MKTKIIVLAIMLALVTASLSVPNTSAAVVEPSVRIEGTLTKDVTDLNNVFEYVTSENETKDLDYKAHGNITADCYNIHYENPFLNASTQGTSSTTGYSASTEMLRDIHDIEYFIIHLINNTNLAASTWYAHSLVNTVDIDITNDYYLLTSATLVELAGSLSSVKFGVVYTVEDEWLNEYVIKIIFRTAAAFEVSSSLISLGIPRASINAHQVKIGDVIERAGKAWNLRKITEVKYVIDTYDSSLDAAYDLGFKFRYAFVSPNLVEVAGVAANNTINTECGDLSSGADIIKIAEVTIPFYFQVAPERLFTADDLTVKYDFDYSLPLVDELTFSSTIANLSRGDFEWTNFSTLIVDTSKITSTLSGDYYTALSSITAGSVHTISATVECSASVYDEILAGAGMVFWSVDTFFDWLYGGLAFVATVIGFGGVYWKSKQRSATTNRANAAR